MKEFIKKMLSDAGEPSTKRVVGLAGALSLIIFMFAFRTDLSVESVLIMSLGALGISGAVSIFGKNNKE